MADTTYPDHAAEAASLDVIGRFAMAQEEISNTLDAYLGTSLSTPVKAVLSKRLRLSDDERLEVLIALAKTTSYPLHIEAYKRTYRDTKAVRDHLAHGGPPLVRWFEDTKEPMMWAFSPSKKVRGGSEPHVYSLTALKAFGDNARWLGRVAWRVHALLTNEDVPSAVRVPSDLPRGAVIDQPADRKHWGTPPVCPLGHGNVYGVLTAYGDAWFCGHCEHLRVRDDSSLAGSRSVLAVPA